MPTINENYQFWNNEFQWSQHRGDVWSREWGGPTNQWHWCIYPRIRRFLPAESILEIGPGQGRWTRFLRSCADNLILTDISDICIEECRRHFGEDGIEYHVGDGRTLQFQADSSVDFVFSFESLIHTELDDLTSYLKETWRVLKPGGTAFLHHSNLGQYRKYYAFTASLPDGLRGLLESRGILDFDGWRARSVSADILAATAEEKGLTVHSQELVPWGGRRLTDCFSILGKGTAAENKVYENQDFVKRAREIRRIAEAY
jgi:2-polyprenyl-3-methyl-5-hydroxy-6-metoxy-1,4-benzoquinol methylase